MAVAINIPPTTPADALWVLFQEQSEAVRKEFVDRVLVQANVQPQPMQKLTRADISARLDEAERDVRMGNVLSCEEVYSNIAAKCPWL